MSRPDGDGGNVITCTHDGLAEHLWEPPRCPVAIPWAVRPAAPAAEADDELHEAVHEVIFLWHLAADGNTRVGTHEADEMAAVILALPALQRLVEQEAEAARLRARIRKLAVQYKRLGEELHSVPSAEAFSDAALDLSRVLDGTDG